MSIRLKVTRVAELREFALSAAFQDPFMKDLRSCR